MIEKILKIVKSSNKRKGRNITIGAVIGFLLSCTGVMGADDYLWIRENGGKIEFNTEKTTNVDGTDGNWNENHPYSNENIWDADTQTYTNNMTLSSSGNNGKGNIYGSNDISYVLRLSGNLSEFNFINNGLIIGTSNSDHGLGIYNDNGSTIETFTNNGLITVSGNDKSYGIYNDKNGTIRTLINSGKIAGSAISAKYYSNSYGIYNSGNMGSMENRGLIIGEKADYNYGIATGSMTSLRNNGSVIGLGREKGGVGIIASSSIFRIENLVNNGLVIGSTTEKFGHGILNTGNIVTLANTGAIFGKVNAIYNERGSINSAYNYGILANGADNSVLNGLTAVDALPDDTDSRKNKILNKGLIFAVLDTGGYKAAEDDYKKFGKIYENEDVITDYEKDNDGNNDFSRPIKQQYTVINAKAIGSDKDNITGTESLKLKNGTLSYGDSQKEKISSDKRYVLNGITNTIEVTGKRNKLNNSVINAYKTAIVMERDETYLELKDTVVNGGLDEISSAILVKGDKNFLTIKGDTIINGEMKSEGDLNTLNLYGKENKTRSSNTESMNIINNITGFGRIQIENDVTFFETAKVTGVERININNGGTLNLRLKKDTGDLKATHALSEGNTDILIAGLEKEGSPIEGTLNFITNGIGTGTVIDMAGTKLENINLRTSSIIYELEVVDTEDFDVDVGDIKLGVIGDLGKIINGGNITFDRYPKYNLIPDETEYNSLDKIYQSLKTDENMNALVDILDSSSDEEQLGKLLSFLGGIYTETPYSFSSELSRKSMGMFRDIAADNQFRPELNKWMIMGGLTHADGGSKDTYYGQNYHEFDTGTADTDVDMKLTGAYALGKYGYSENISLGITAGGNKSEAELSMSKVKGNSGYIGVFAENYRGNLTLKAGAGIQYSEYDADRATLGGHSYNEKYSDMAYDIYLNGRYSNPIGENLFLEPYGTLSYTHIKQDSADEGNKTLAIETDSKSFSYTTVKVGVDLKKIIPHEKGKSTLSAGISYTRILSGADEEYITGRFKDGSDFDILVSHKNEHSIGLNAKYTLELENGILFDVKGSYALERDSHNGTGKNRNKGEWIVGAGLGYKF